MLRTVYSTITNPPVPLVVTTNQTDVEGKRINISTTDGYDSNYTNSPIIIVTTTTATKIKATTTTKKTTTTTVVSSNATSPATFLSFPVFALLLNPQ